MARLIYSVLLLLCIASPAAAQRTRGFVEGGVLADYDPTQREDQVTTLGATAGAAVFLTQRWSLRLEVDYPRWHESHRRSEVRVADRIEAFSLHEGRRSRSMSVLIGRDMGGPSRVRLSWLAGLTVTGRDSRSTGWTERRDLQGHVTSHTDVNRLRTDQWWAATVGADLTIALSEHVAVVPQVRVHTYGGLSEHTSEVFVRPRLVLRWRF